MKNRIAKSCLSLIIIATPFLSHALTVKEYIPGHGGTLTPSGKGWGEKSENPSPISKNSQLEQNGIFYHGGPVMGTRTTNIPNIYYIWYGNWAGNSAVKLLANFAMGFGRTYNYNINSSYTNADGLPVQRLAKFPKPSIFDNYSMGTDLNDYSVFAVVTNAITAKKLPLDRNGLYVVLSSADVNETSGLCTSYCGWHKNTAYQQINLKYAYIGNPERCPNSCAAELITPNNNFAADSMANIIAHELEELITNPRGNGWYGNSGEENADKCAWTFGKTKTDSHGAKYNTTIAFKHYLIQMNWLNANGGMCVNGLKAV